MFPTEETVVKWVNKGLKYKELMHETPRKNKNEKSILDYE